MFLFRNARHITFLDRFEVELPCEGFSDKYLSIYYILKKTNKWYSVIFLYNVL